MSKKISDTDMIKAMDKRKRVLDRSARDEAEANALIEQAKGEADKYLLQTLVK